MTMTAEAKPAGAVNARAATYNLADLFDLVAQTIPERVVCVWGDRQVSYADLADRSDRVAAALLRAGVKRGDTVGLIMANCPEYLESLLALLKIGAISFNVNFRYLPKEIRYILEDAGARAVIQGAEFTTVIDNAVEGMDPSPIRFVVDHTGPVDTAGGTLIDYHAATSLPVGEVDIQTGRSSEDSLLIYTGGTTGMPKGVEWACEDMLFGALMGGGAGMQPEITNPYEIRDRVGAGYAMAQMLPGPLIHGGTMWAALIGMLGGHKLVFKHVSHFDAELTWDLMEREKTTTLGLIGDAMAVPLLDAWSANPGRWSCPSLMFVSWGGAAMSEGARSRFREYFPNLRMASGMGSTESGQFGSGNVETGGNGFMLLQGDPSKAVIIDLVRRGGVGETGILARTGHLPRGYWGDAKKTAETFVTVDGKRWCLTGDLARIEEDGTIRVFGRDSSSINTGGEKVFAEEVEEVVRLHPSVADAAIVGVRNKVWGQAVTAVVRLRPGTSLTLEEIRAHGRERLAGYKLPKSLVIVDSIPRTPAGKLLTPAVIALATERVQAAEAEAGK